MLRFLIAAFACSILATPVMAQGPAGFDPRQTNLDKTQNPAISFITDARALAGDATPDDLRLVLKGFELGVQAYANPYARGDIYLGYHDGVFEVEEAYALFTSLPGGFNLLGGQYRVGIGRFNIMHPHMFQFMDFPLLVTEYLGHEGYADVGAGPSLLLGVGDIPLTLSMDILDGERFAGHSHDHGDEHNAGGLFRPAQDSEEPEHRGRKIQDLTYNGRASLFFTLKDDMWLEAGGTVGTVVYNSAEELRNTWFGGDFKLKYRPDRRTSLTVAAEVVNHHRQVHEIHGLAPGILGAAQDEARTTVKPVGFFAYADYQFNRRWNVGALADYVQTVEDTDESQFGLGGFAGFGMFEESALLRLLVRHDTMPFDREDEWNAQFQLIFSLGPHKPHQY